MDSKQTIEELLNDKTSRTVAEFIFMLGKRNVTYQKMSLEDFNAKYNNPQLKGKENLKDGLLSYTEIEDKPLCEVTSLYILEKGNFYYVISSSEIVKRKE